MRRIALTAFTAGLLIAIGVPALAEQSYCNSDNHACATLTDQSVSGGTARSTAMTFTQSDTRKSGVEVIQNYETHHVFGWTTDNSWQSGSSGDRVASETAKGSFGCSGGTYKFYSRHYIGGSQFYELQTNQFSCKA